MMRIGSAASLDICLSILPKMLLRRCHPIRMIRATIFIIVAIIIISTLWQFGVSHPPATPDVLPVRRSQDTASPLYAGVVEVNDHEQARQNVQPQRVAAAKEPDPTAQAMLDYIGMHLDVRYNVLANEGQRYHVNISFTNEGNEQIRPCCWTIFFYHMKFIDTDVFNSGYPTLMRADIARLVRHNRTAVHNPNNFQLDHINGYTFRLQPTASFGGLKPGETVTVRISGGGWAVSRGEVIPNWYVSNDLSLTIPRLIRSTMGEHMNFVGEFNTLEKATRYEDDNFRPYSAEQRFKKNKVQDLGHAPNAAIIPTPVVMQLSNRGRKVRMDTGWTISYDRGLVDSANFLKNHLKIFGASDMQVEVDDNEETLCKSKRITLRLSDGLSKLDKMDVVHSEGYVVSVSPENDCVSITGPTAAAVFYGAVTLVSLAQSDDVPETPRSYWFPAAEVIDAPRYEYRGVMVDVARQFHTKEELFKLLEALALFKMNKLHLHLGDDEGWRLEIPGLEELTEFGSKRGHDLKERHHLMSMLGSGPFTNTSSSGFYTIADYKDILRHAKALFIEVIPEFDMPGHSHAAIKSMEARYERFKKEGNEKEGLRFLLSDRADQSVYRSGQFFKDSAINPCLESTYRFVDWVVTAVVDIYKDIAPLRRFHFGGDEVPGDAYTASPACSQFLIHHPKLSDTKSLKTYFVRRVANIIGKHGLVPFGWEDAYSTETGYPMVRNDMTAKDVISQAWYNIWESGLAMRAYQYANLGYKVVLSPTTSLYFDNPQEPDPEDWGLHWATRYIDTKRTFLFRPDNMYDSIDYDFSGHPITKQELCGTGRIQCPNLNAPKNILGLEGATWTELIRTSDKLDAMLWPRLIATAERAWHKANWEAAGDADAVLTKARKRDWVRFSNTVGYKELKRLENLGVSFYLPRPGIRVRNGGVYVNTMFPGLVVQYSSDDGLTWSDFDRSASYKGRILFATRSYNSRRRSVPVVVNLA